MNANGRIIRGMQVVDVRGFPVGSVEAVSSDRIAVLTSDGEAVWIWASAVFTIDSTGTISLLCNHANLDRYTVDGGRAAS